MAVPVDRVQAIKRESSAGGGDPADDVDYFAPLDASEDALESQGLFVQPPGGPKDEACYITRDNAGNMLFIDPVVGVEKTLTELLAGGGGPPVTSVTSDDFLLDNIPVAESGTNDVVYVPAYSSGLLQSETWKRDDNTVIRQILYSYTGRRITQEIRKVYDVTGTILRAQVTWTYSYTGNILTSSVMTRDVSTVGSVYVSYLDDLLNNRPTAETGASDAAYLPTYSGNKITLETWKRNDTTLVKSIAYTYSGARLTTEIRKVFATDGITILAQVTWNYSYTGQLVTSAVMTRDI
jgi:hypothetical protein